MNNLLLLIVCGACMLPANAQKLKVEDIDLPVSKTAKKKGMFVNTTLTENGDIRTFISYDMKGNKLGIDVFTVDATGKLIDNSSEIASKSVATKYNIDIPAPGTMENPSKGVNVLRLVGSTGIAGKLKIEEGYFKPKYATSTDYGPYITTYTSILRGYKFQDEKVNKSDYRLNMYGANFKEGDNLEQSYSILEGIVPLTVGYFRKEATIAFMGWDARIPDKDAENAANVIYTGQFNGNTFDFFNIKPTILEYNQRLITKTYDYQGNLAVLVSTLNAPTSSAKLNEHQAKGIPYMTYLTMDKESNIVDNVTFESGSVRGNFSLGSYDGNHFIIGNINANHDGYARNDIGTSTHFQVVKIKEGKVVNKQMTSKEEMLAKAVTPKGEKTKLKYKDLQFTNFIQSPNGDGSLTFARAFPGKEDFIFHVDNNGYLKTVYAMPRFEGIFHSVQVMGSGNDIYVLYRTQNGEIAQGISKSISRGAGYMKNVTFSRVDELMTFGRVHKINLLNKTISDPVDFLPDVILGADSMYKGSSGELILPVRDAKRNYRMVTIK